MVSLSSFMKANWHGGFGPEISEEEKHNKNNAFSKKTLIINLEE